MTLYKNNLKSNFLHKCNFILLYCLLGEYRDDPHVLSCLELCCIYLLGNTETTRPLFTGSSWPGKSRWVAVGQRGHPRGGVWVLAHVGQHAEVTGHQLLPSAASWKPSAVWAPASRTVVCMIYFGRSRAYFCTLWLLHKFHGISVLSEV